MILDHADRAVAGREIVFFHSPPLDAFAASADEVVHKLRGTKADDDRDYRSSTAVATAMSVGSDTGAVPGLPRVRFPCPPAEPDVRLSPHPALRMSWPLLSL
ncbi:hypothetical protein [Pseudonocardia kunmingensis]|uniref:Uncharacterized protein n=1 Tax=Pseudonocardia kunmingensis TaxID=630975 RepID=A0A543CY81_9PSEU|nr:hypothetical protein [Pseudonocardia kunmingensis]TQM02062.1 hypothetical protein FB558_7921 [Pseudonocardia kunmingensis]